MSTLPCALCRSSLKPPKADLASIPAGAPLWAAAPRRPVPTPGCRFLQFKRASASAKCASRSASAAGDDRHWFPSPSTLTRHRAVHVIDWTIDLCAWRRSVARCEHRRAYVPQSPEPIDRITDALCTSVQRHKILAERGAAALTDRVFARPAPRSTTWHRSIPSRLIAKPKQRRRRQRTRKNVNAAALVSRPLATSGLEVVGDRIQAEQHRLGASPP